MQPGTRRSCYVRYLTQNRDLGLAEPERGADEADQVGQAGHDVSVTLMEAGRTGLDQYFVVLGRRLVDVPELQHIGSALPVLGDCFHGGRLPERHYLPTCANQLATTGAK
jgi:hypothetical protein